MVHNIPKTMKAFILMGHGDLDQLVYRTDWPVPAYGDHEVLIKVHACGLNNTDVNTRIAWYSKSVNEGTSGGALVADDMDASWGGGSLELPRIQGADVCGTVVAVGTRVDQNLIDKRVLVDCWLRQWAEPHNRNKTGYFGSECDGGFAEYTVVDYRNVYPLRSELSDTELATFATSWMTAEGMLNRAGVNQEDTVLITGASGGVGSALISLANRRGAKTIAMASEAKWPQIEALSPWKIIGRSPGALGTEKVSVVADVVAGQIFPELICRLERGGRYVTSGAIAGPIVDLDVRTLYLHDLTLLGSTVVEPGTFADLVGYIERGEISPVLAATYPLCELHAAQLAFIEKKHTGNIVVSMDE